MEFYQLKYFQAVVAHGGVHKAAAQLHVSAPAISQAISNLEDNLNCQLFQRRGRNLDLTPTGKHLFKRAAEILDLREKTRVELMGPASVGEVVIAGREVFLEHHGVRIGEIVHRTCRGASLHLVQMSGEKALEAVKQGHAHLCLTIQAPPPSWARVVLEEVRSVICAAKNHPLARHKGYLKIEDVMKHPFISPNAPLFGRAGLGNSIDGWPDDRHPRKISHVVESMTVFRALLNEKVAIAFLPDFWVRQHGFALLKVEKITACAPFKLICSAHRSTELGWLRAIMEEIAKYEF